jgi:hypothetical protein
MIFLRALMLTCGFVQVTTIRYRDSHELKLPTHPNQTHILRALDNREGLYPYLSRSVYVLFKTALLPESFSAFLPVSQKIYGQSNSKLWAHLNLHIYSI